MKKTILTVAALAAGVFTLQAQSHHDSDREANIVSHTFEDQDISISAGGRLTMDGAHYINDKTDMSSGVKVGEVRLNVFASFHEKYDLKIDLDFANKKVNFKDIFARWNINKNSSLKIGNFVSPFSMERQKSTSDLQFIAQAGSQEALTLSRRLGVSYRYHNNKLWFEGGLFASNMNKHSMGGDSGWGTSGRFVFNPQLTDDLMVHVGLGLSYRTPDPNGFIGGDDDYNRDIDFTSPLETVVDDKHFLNANINHARNEFKYNGEFLLLHKKFFLQSEYTGSFITRKRDNQKLFEEQLGGIWSHQTLEAWENWFGKSLRSLSFGGVYVQAGYLLMGDKYEYDRNDAIHKPARNNALEVVVRYSHTNLDDVDGIFYNGKFYDPAKGVGADNPNFNYSVGGGIVNSYTLGLNYYMNKHARLMVNYGYSRINNLYEEDSYAHTLQARLQLTF